MSIELRGISFGYRPNVPVLQEFSIYGRAGEAIALTGPSGSGKSTVLGVAGLLLRPQAGSVLIAERGIAQRGRARMRTRASQIAWVFQSLTVLGGRSAAENVALGLLAQGYTRSRAYDLSCEQLAGLGIAEFANTSVDELSGGQLQRVCIARALVTRPEVILADEPTGQLDRTTSDVVMDAFLGAVQDAGVALLMATHDLRLAKKCDRLVEV